MHFLLLLEHDFNGKIQLVLYLPIFPVESKCHIVPLSSLQPPFLFQSCKEYLLHMTSILSSFLAVNSFSSWNFLIFHSIFCCIFDFRIVEQERIQGKQAMKVHETKKDYRNSLWPPNQVLIAGMRVAQDVRHSRWWKDLSDDTEMPPSLSCIKTKQHLRNLIVNTHLFFVSISGSDECWASVCICCFMLVLVYKAMCHRPYYAVSFLHLYLMKLFRVDFCLINCLV